MLEKNKKILLCDAHFHLSDCIKSGAICNGDRPRCKNTELICNGDRPLGKNIEITGCSCAHSKEEWENQQRGQTSLSKIYYSYGLHPQSIGFIDIEENIKFLEDLLNNSNSNISAIGEAGFDFFTTEFKSNAAEQEKAFVLQVELAIKYNKPLIIHCRKANEKMFEYSKKLKKVPRILFHSFMGTYVEAGSLLKRGINGRFSFGKQLMNNNKKVIECVKMLPTENLLLETDAPYQTLKGETKTYVSDIQMIYEQAYKLRNPDISYEEFCAQLNKNFIDLLVP